MACDIILGLLIWQVMELELPLVGLDSIAKTLASKLSCCINLSRMKLFPPKNIQGEAAIQMDNGELRIILNAKTEILLNVVSKLDCSVMRKVRPYVDIHKSLNVVHIIIL